MSSRALQCITVELTSRFYFFQVCDWGKKKKRGRGFGGGGSRSPCWVGLGSVFDFSALCRVILRRRAGERPLPRSPAAATAIPKSHHVSISPSSPRGCFPCPPVSSSCSSFVLERDLHKVPATCVCVCLCELRLLPSSHQEDKGSRRKGNSLSIQNSFISFFWGGPRLLPLHAGRSGGIVKFTICDDNWPYGPRAPSGWMHVTDYRSRRPSCRFPNSISIWLWSFSVNRQCYTICKETWSYIYTLYFHSLWNTRFLCLG